jgi:predicted transcriptional regulator
VADRHYKGYRVYSYIALARLAAELDLDLTSPELSTQLPHALAALPHGISKEEVLHAIRSNSHMTDKVLEYLVGEGFASVALNERGYQIRITVAGVDHLRKYRVFYQELYARELAEHYRYTGAPSWIR